MRRTLPILGIILLAACTPSVAYDIDVTCDAKFGYFGDDVLGDFSEGSRVLSCTLGGADDFLITCDRSTYQNVNNYHYCTTTDGKSVRVHVVK